jgi:DNA-binding XRE family transcriptional regulator
MIRGTELKEWRKRNGYTQEMLRLALGIRSRQTIITWESSEQPISKAVELALLALEFLPEKCINVSSAKFAGFVPTIARERFPSL